MADKAPATTKLQETGDKVEGNGDKKEEQKKLPQLGALEDDDEFEVCLLMTGSRDTLDVAQMSAHLVQMAFGDSASGSHSPSRPSQVGKRKP